MPYSYSNWDDKNNPPLPCWSAGRLVNIFEVCTGELFERKRWKESSDILLDDVLEQIELAIINAIEGVEFDFSKLEEGV